MKRTIGIIGAGRVARVLARLWHRAGVLEVRDIVNRSPESAQQAVAFIGAGHAVADVATMTASDIYLIGTSDDAIGPACEALAAAGRLSPSSVVFHCSGALASSQLAAAALAGAAIASVHPVRSFAQPERVAADFAGTWCGIEGDPRAVAVLTEAFTAVGARLVPLRSDAKALYHSAAVFASNYLVTLLDVAARAYEGAGMSREQALALMEPLVRETVDNVFHVGPEAALTGPIARGDMQTVERQQRAVSAWQLSAGALYKRFAELTRALAQRGEAKS